MARKKAPDPDVREALIALARLLGDDGAVAEVTLALDDPAAYLRDLPERAEERDLEKPGDLDPWLALVDALCERVFAWEIDWKFGVDDVHGIVERLIPGGPLGDDRWGWFLDPKYDKKDTYTLLGLAGGFLTANGLALLLLEIDGDSYVLAVRPAADVEAATALAKRARHHVDHRSEPLPPEALAPPQPGGPRLQRTVLPDLPYGVCGRAHDAVICLGTGHHGSEWLDLRVWPPKRYPWPTCWLSSADGGGPGGAWVIVESPPDPTRTRAEYRVAVVDDPLRSYEEAAPREVPYAEPPSRDPVDSAFFVDGRIVAFPWSASDSSDLAHLEHDGRLVPAPGLPRAERSGLGAGRTGAGTPYVVFAGRAWELGPKGFAPFGGPFPSAKETPTAPAAGDAFYALPAARLVRVSRDATQVDKPLGDRSFVDIQPGPWGSVLLTQNNFDKKPAIAWVWLPEHDVAIRLERTLLKIRECHWIVWSPAIDRIVVCIGDTLIAVPPDLLRTLPQITASTGRKLRKPIVL